MESNAVPSELSMIINQYMSDIFKQKRKQIKIISLLSTESFIDTFEKKLQFWDINWKHDIYANYENYFLGRFHLRRDLLVNKLNNHFLAFQAGSLLFLVSSNTPLPSSSEKTACVNSEFVPKGENIKSSFEPFNCFSFNLSGTSINTV